MPSSYLLIYLYLFAESLPYRVHPETGLVDMEALSNQAALYKPAMIICGGSAYPREFDYAGFRKIADDNGSLLMMDMSHISGLVATGEAKSPFEFCDIVTTTTHKTLRGPRAGMIFYRKDSRDFDTKICGAVFPGLQGGPHEHQIAGIATQLKEVATPEFKEYAKQVIANSRAFASHLVNVHGYLLATGGSDNHLILWDLKPQGLSGGKMQALCDQLSITVNKNTVLGDISALNPGGVRLGTSALTTRGLKEADFCIVADFLHKAVQLGLKIQATMTTKKLVEFESLVKDNEEVRSLKQEVKNFITKFPMPGFEVSEMRYQDVNADI